MPAEKRLAARNRISFDVRLMSSPESSAAPNANSPWRWPLLLALFALALIIFTRHDDYPFYYHPDEFGKCKQVVDGTRSFNFHHPLLLLNVASPLKKLAGKGPDASKPAQLQKAVIAGRRASALFAAITVVALAIAGYLLGGPGGAFAAGIATLLHPLLFEHAHIFKEDAALTMGLALTCMAAALFRKSPDCRRRTALLGVAVGLAVSGKYIGLAALIVALPVVCFAPGERRARRIAIFAAAFAITFILANRQMFTHLGEWRESFGHEFGMSVSGSRGLAAQNPVAQYLEWFRQTVPTVAIVFLALNVLSLATTARRRSLADWLIFLFPIAFTGLLMLSPRVSDRYFLPAAVLFNFNALVGVGVSAEWFTRAFGKFRFAGQIAFAAIALGIGWWGQFQLFGKTYAQFQTDDRRELETWMDANLPAGSKVVQDYAIHLPDPDDHKQEGMKRPFKHEVRGHEFVPELGTLDDIRAQGVRYVATTPKKSQRYTSGGMIPSDDAKAEFERRKTFYGALPQQAKLVWQRGMSEIDTLHPGIELYDLGQKP